MVWVGRDFNDQQLFVALIGLLLVLDANGLSTSMHKEIGRLQEIQKEDIA